MCAIASSSSAWHSLNWVQRPRSSDRDVSPRLHENIKAAEHDDGERSSGDAHRTFHGFYQSGHLEEDLAS